MLRNWIDSIVQGRSRQSKQRNRRQRREAFQGELMRQLQVEPLEGRLLLAVTAVIDANNDALITGAAVADTVTMSIENQGLANETLRISDPGGVTAGAGFTQDGANSATVLTSAITGLDIFITTLDSSDTINVQATPAGILTHVNEGGGPANVINVSSDAPANTGNLDGLDGTLTLDNAVGGGGRTLNISESGSVAADTVNINTSVADAFTGTAGGGWTIQEVNLGSPLVNLSLGSAGDRVNVNGELVGERVNISTGAGADTVAFANGVSLQGGTVDGGADPDTLDYSAYTTSVAANLGLDVSGLTATLGGDQENPPQSTLAAGTATISNYDHINKTFDISVTATDLNPASVTGFHIHRAPFGVNGPIIIDLLALGTLTPAGTGFTYSATGVSLATSLLGGVVNEASLLGGITYVNIHTAAAPGGLIRGQLFSTGNVTATSGTATGTGGVSNVENVIGSSAMDGLIGNAGANSLEGRNGNDTMVGGPGSDTMTGGNDNDIMVWSNGDGTDVMNGDAGTDTVQVNGNVTADDVFTIGANGTRVDFDRVSPGPFSLDIGTTETLTPIGIEGNDSFTAASLAGVADLTNVHLAGLAGNDTFTVTPSTTVNYLVTGSTPTTNPGDSLTVDLAGTTGGSTNGTPNGQLTFTSAHTAIAYRGIEDLNALNGLLGVTINAGGGNNVIRAFRDGADIVVTVDGTEAYRGDFDDVNALNVNGEGGNDSLLVDFTSGDPVPTGGVGFDGGPGADNGLGVRGNGTSNAVYTPSATTPGNGTVVVDMTNTITFSNLTPVDIFGMNNATLNLPNGNDVLTIQNGVDFTQGGTNQALRVSGTSGGVAIETAAFFNNTTMTIDTTATDGAADNITITSANNAHNNTNITINTGAGANDLLTVNGMVTVAGTFTGNVPTINLNNVINAATITGTATVINVDDPGQIQDAHDLAATLAAPGALVNVAAGTYNENVVISKNLRIDGNDAPRPVVDGGAAGSVFTIGAFTVLLDDLVIQNGAAANGGGINNSGTLSVRDSLIQNNVANGAAGSGGGILNTGAGTIDVRNSAISNNQANRAGGGIEDNAGAGVRVTLVDVNLNNNNAGVAPATAAPGNGGGLHVTGAGSVNITRGTVNGNVAALEGGGLWNGTGTMTLNNVTISGNTASGNGADDGGGGVFNNGGTVNIQSSLISNNVADGTLGSGGGIFNNTGGTVSITTSTISGNRANRAGGGIEDNVGNLITIVDSTIDSNNVGVAPAVAAPGNGGGIHITGAGRVTLDGSTISRNLAANEGGGLWNSATGTFTLTNSTISTNTANGATGGGGIFNTNGGVMSLDSVTIALNTAPTGDGIRGGTGGVTLRNTIAAGNPAQQTFGQNLTGTIASLDFNLIGDPDTGVLVGPKANTIFNADPRLGPLVNNTGPTETHLPLAGSPAIGFGNTVLTLDQRNVTRPQGAEDDIGAVEVDLNGFVVSANDLTVGNAGDGNADSFRIINNNANGTVELYINQTFVRDFPQASTGLIVIRGSADDDTLTVDNSNGLIGAHIVFDGDGNGGPPPANQLPFPIPGGLDTLRLVGTTPTTTTYNPGETPDRGVVFQENNEIVQRVEFFGLEPVEVRGTGAADTLVVAGTLLGVGFPQALNADNSINYTQGPNSGDVMHPVFAGDATGEVTVDGFERLEFSNFGRLRLGAGAGSDEINLNNTTTPTALANIDVNGGDPTASDTVIVNGTPAVDTISFNPITNDDGTVQVNALPLVTLTTVEHVTINGQGGNDNLRATTPQTAEVLTFTLGVDATEGSLAIRSGAAALLGMNFVDVGAGGSLTLADAGGRTDTLIYNATDANDGVLVSAAGVISLLGTGPRALNVTATGVASLTLVALDGDDQISVAGNHPFAGGVNVQGGNPDAGSDTLNLLGSGAGAVTLDLSTSTITEAGFGAVSYSGMENVNIDANNALAVTGTALNDTYNVTPLGGNNNGSFTHDQTAGVVFNYTDATSVTFAGGAGGDDVLAVYGDEAADTITATATTVVVDGSVVTVGANVDELNVFGLGGNDNINLTGFNATPRVVVYAGDGNDVVRGSAQPDIIYGGAGDDALMGGANNDTIYGEVGNDRFGDPDVRDPAANDPGDDLFDGGAGSDQFFWDPGDGDDRVEGGAGGSDQIFFFGNAGGEQFFLFADVNFPSRFHLFRVQAGIDIDAADVEEVNLVALGGTDTVTVGRSDLGVLSDLSTTTVRVVDVSLGADGAADSVIVEGRPLDDNLLLSVSAGIVEVAGLSYDVRLDGADAAADRLTVRGNEGNDSIKADPGVEAVILITLEGGAGNDFLSADAILNGDAGNDTLIGGSGNDSINGGDGDDVIDGRGGTNTVNGGAGTDTILVSGTAASETITTTHTAGVFTIAGGLSAGTNNITAMEQVRIEVREGSDTINVNTLAAGGLNYEVRGGDPIGAVGDTLNLNSPNAITFMPGPEADNGAFVDNVTGAIISYDEIEDANATIVGGQGNVTVMGTGADDDITVVGVAANTVDVQVNDGPVVRYTGVSVLNVQGKNGDDDINVDVNVAALGVAITVDGGLPTVGSDSLRITGVNGPDDLPTYLPTDADAGTFMLNGQQPIQIIAIEKLIYDGESDNETLTFLGDGLGAGTLDNFVHIPGQFPDSGLGYDYPVNRPQTLLPLNYENLGDFGLVTYDGRGGLDLITFHLTTTSDALNVNFPAANSATFDLLSGFGLYNQVSTTAVEEYELESGQVGFDSIFLDTPVLATSLAVLGGGPADSLYMTADATTTAVTIAPNPGFAGGELILGFGTAIITTGEIDLMFYTGNGADTLTVASALGDNEVRVERGSAGGDLVTSDTLPPIEFTGVNTFVVDASHTGSDVVTFQTWFLAGAVNTNYQMIGGTTDTLVIEGSDGANDNFTVTNPAAGSVAVRDNNGTGVTVTETSGNLGRLQINTLGRDDRVTVNVGATDLVGVPITYDGGGGSDLLTISGTPATQVNTVTYRPGPATVEGRITHDADANPANGAAMTIDFLNLEPVIDLVPALNLVVQGTDADNQIDYRAAGANGLVSVDEFETIEFSNKATLTLNGNAGSDVIHLDANIVPTSLTSIVVNGNAPTLSGDTLIVNGRAAATVTVAHTGASSGTIAGAEPVTITYGTLEGLSVNAQTSTTLAMTGSASYTVSPGPETDQGEILSSGVPVSFDGYGSGDTLALTGTGGGTVTVNGTAANDIYTVATNTITITGRAAVTATTLPTATLNGFAGQDTFDVNGNNTFTTLNVHGGSDDDQDTLNLTNNAGAATVNLGASTVAGYGALINYTGLQTVAPNANAQALTVVATANDDTLVVTPFTATTGRLQNNNVDPVVDYSNLGASTITLDPSGGQDTVVVNGNSSSETIEINTTAGRVQASGQTIVHGLVAEDALTVNGLQGSDIFNVTAAAYPIFIDGGDPIGLTGDTINLNATADVTVQPGPESDEGRFELVGLAPVSFDHIEQATIDANGANIGICGTPGDDNITVVGDDATVPTNDFTAVVNGGPLVRYTEVGGLVVDGKEGDDDIDVEVNDLALIAFVVRGSAPSVAGDTLTVTGVTGGPDNAQWTPTGDSGGTWNVGAQAITVESLEALVYDGESESEPLTVIGDGTGAGNADRFVHTPGLAADAGHVAVSSNDITLLGISYVNLGLAAAGVTASGLGGSDTLVALGTHASDTVAVSFTALDAIDIDLTSPAGTHVDLLSAAVENYVIDALEGDDDVNVQATINAGGTFAVRGGGPGSGSDTLRVTATVGGGAQSLAVLPDTANPDDQDITGLGAVIDVTGIELIRFIGSGGDDTLTVNPGNGDNTVRVKADHPGAWDTVLSDSLPKVDFLSMNTFVVDASGQGSDVVTFQTWFLQGAVNTNYRLVGGLTDTLVVEGSDGADDSFTATDLGAGAVSIRDNNALGGTGVTVSELSGNLGRLQINTLGGDDLVTFASVPRVDSGVDTGDPVASGDRLVVNSTAGMRVTQGALSTTGLIDQTGAGTIDYANIERLDLASLTAGSTLTVRGTDDNDTITVADLQPNLVWINDGAIIGFADSFANLDVQGRFGTDTFEITPIDNVAITVQGGSPTLGETVIVNGTTGADTITVDNIVSDGARVTVGALRPVTLQTIENFELVGRGGGDNLTILGSAAADRFEHTPGSTVDSGVVALRDAARELLSTSYQDLGAAGTVTVNGNGGADVLVALGTGASDTAAIVFTGANAIDIDLTTPHGVHVDLLSVAVQTYHVEMLEGDDTVNVRGAVNVSAGGSLTVVGGGNGEGSDVLNYTGAGGALTLDLQAGTIVEAANAPLAYDGIEQVNLNAAGSTLAVAGTGDDDDITVTVFNATSGKIERGLAVQQNGQVQSPIQPPLVSYSAISAASSVNFDLRGGEDTLVVVGSANPQTFAVNATARTVTIDDLTDGGIDGRVSWTAMSLESLEIFGLEGNDTFDVTPGPIPIFIDGGDPIGQTAGDRINILQPDPMNPTAVIFESGPESDEGGFIVGSNARISFDHIEALGAINAAKAVIIGTNGDDDITVIARTALTNPNQFTGANGVRDFTTSVNSGPDILWIDTPLIFIDGLSGDDDITVRTPAPPVPGPNPAVWDVDVYVAGGTPSAPATGDRLRVETPYESNNITYQPTSPDSGIMSILNAGGATHSTIYIGQWLVDCDGNPQTTDDILRSSPGGIEHLIYDGVSAEGGFTLPDPDNPAPNQNPATAFTDNITVLGDGFGQATSNDRFVHTPGSTADAGRVDIADTTNNQTMLALQYNNIGLGGSVTVNGLTGSDALVALGTAASDVVNVAFTGANAVDLDLVSPAGTHVDLLSANVEHYIIDTLDGDDIVNATAPINTTTGSFSVRGGGPGSGSDVLNLVGAAGAVESVTITPDANDSHAQDITGLGTQIDALGFELLSYTGTGDDTVIVNPGAGDNDMRVARGDGVNLVTSDSLPDIEFSGHIRFVADTNEQGSDVVTFKTWFLGGPGNPAYDMLGGGTDTLVIEGSDGAIGGDDSFTVTNPPNVVGIGNPNVAVRDNRGNQITVRGFGVGRLQINTLGGDDLVTVDVGVANGSDLITVPIGFDGGTQSDTLRVEGTPASGLTAAFYSPGPAVTEGRLQHEGGDFLMTIDFVNLEPVIDLVPGTLTVNGTNAANAINYIQSPNNTDWGLVSVDEFETIEFDNKTDVTLNGAAGNDEIHVAPTTVGFSGTLFVNGEDPTLSGDLLVVNGAAATVTVNHAAGTIAGAGPTLIDYGTVERIKVNANLAGTLAMTGSQDYTVNPGAETDQGEILSSGVPVDFDGFGNGDTLALTGTGGGTVTVNGTAANDRFNVTTNTVTIVGRATITATTLPTATLNALDGDDVFAVTGVQSFTTLNVHGGDGDDDDTLLATNAGAAVVVDLGARTVVGYGGTINYTGLQLINADANSQTFRVNGTADDDTLDVVPFTADSGTVQANGSDPVVRYDSVSANAITVDGAGGENTVVVHGNETGETFTVTTALVSVGGQTINYLAQALTVKGEQGADTFNVTPGAIPIFIDGGDPIGSANPGDAINIQAGDANTTFLPGPEGDEGGINVTGSQTVSFDHIENLTITNPNQMSVCGTNGDDEITVIATGTNDFQFAVNDSPLASVTDADSLVLEGKAGDDDLVLRAATGFAIPVTLDGDFVAFGGTPSSLGDRVKISTPYAGERVEYRPTSSSGGTVTLTSAGSVITIDDAETFLFDGEDNGVGAFATALNVFGNAGTNTIVHTPGSGDNEGTIRVDELLAVTYEGLDPIGAGALLIDGEAGIDRLIALGTSSADAFQVPGVPRIQLNARIPINTLQVEAYTLDGLDGDDSFTIVPVIDPSVDSGIGSIPILVSGEGPSGSDHLAFGVNGANAAPNDVVVQLDAAPATPALVTTITQVGLAPVTLSGIETAAIDAIGTGAAGNNLYVVGTRVEDQINFIPLSADSGIFTALGIPTQFAFDGVVQGTHSFTISGGPGGGQGGTPNGGFADKIILQGTAGRDLIRVNGANRRASVEVLPIFAASGTLWRDVTLHNADANITVGGLTFPGGIIETITAEGNDGDDTFWVVPADVVGNGLVANVHGGSPRASDALVVTALDANNTPTPLDANDFIIIHRSRTPDAGTVLPFNNSVRQPNIAYENVEVVSANINPVSRNNGDPNLLIMGPDLNEPNEFRNNSAFLGSGSNLQIINGEIFPNVTEHPGVPEDHDYYRVVAEVNGTLDFQVYFLDQNGLVPGNGDVNIEVLDVNGNVIAGFGSNEAAGDQNERVRIPAVAGQTYYLHVFGGTTNVVNGYNVTILNDPSPVPYAIELKDLAPGNLPGNNSNPNYVCPQTAPDSPTLNSDTGRSQLDNITCDATPTLFFRMDDAILLQDLQGNDGTVFTNNPPDQQIPIPFQTGLTPGYRIAIFDEGQPQQTTNPGNLPQVPLGFATQVAAGVYTFTVPNATPLSDGSHFLSARVQIVDPSNPQQTGWGARSESLEIIVDTVIPPVSFGQPGNPNDGVAPDSDTGVSPPNPDTIVDRVTRDTTPKFWGRAEADATIRVFADRNGNGVLDLATDVFLGQATAIPLDGTNQEPDGYWEIESIVDLNDPNFFPVPDGLRTIFVNAEDVAGNVNNGTNAGDILQIFIDTQGPVINSVVITNFPGYDLFDPKPSTDGPTPLASSLTIKFTDPPNRVPPFLYPALKADVAAHPGHYRLVGDANGIIPIATVTVTNLPVTVEMPVAMATVVLTFFEPLPDDRFTLTVSDAISDPVGNHLDGESNAIEPQENPLFPTGDGVPGGDFEARFTIDTRPEIGMWAAGSAWIDTNGNTIFDPKNLDFTNRDIVYAFGNGSPTGAVPNGGTQAFTSDDFFAGNFRNPGPDGLLGTADDGPADGFDKLAVYGSLGFGINGPWRFLIDGNNDGVPDGSFAQTTSGFSNTQLNGLPVAGNFDGNAANGDEVGIFTGTVWYLDTNGDFVLDRAVGSQLRGYPIVGDFDGDGLDDLATWHNESVNSGQFQFDLANDGLGTGPIRTIDFGFIGVRERPVAADMDQDGIDDVGLWSPDRAGIVPDETAEWYFLISNDPTGARRVTGQVNTLNHAFEPVPFGKDLYMEFGSEFAIPIVGNFDPPASASSGSGSDTGGEPTLPPELHPYDVNRDGYITAIDVLQLINRMTEEGSQPLGNTQTDQRFDPNRDQYLSPLDALVVINYLSGSTSLSGEGEGSAVASDLAEQDLQFTEVVSTSSASINGLTLASSATPRSETPPGRQSGLPRQPAAEAVDRWFGQAEEFATSDLDELAGDLAHASANLTDEQDFDSDDLWEDLLHELVQPLDGRQRNP